jgi:hypothetical protein
MNEPHWTKKPPESDGWHWWRLDMSFHAVIYLVRGGWVYSGVGCRDAKVFGGQWWSEPIPEPPGGDAVENCRETDHA